MKNASVMEDRRGQIFGVTVSNPIWASNGRQLKAVEICCDNKEPYRKLGQAVYNSREPTDSQMKLRIMDQMVEYYDEELRFIGADDFLRQL